VKTIEEEGVGACSLACNTLGVSILGVEGCAGISGWD
jgi:hypothetical protein